MTKKLDIEPDGIDAPEATALMEQERAEMLAQAQSDAERNALAEQQLAEAVTRGQEQELEQKRTEFLKWFDRYERDPDVRAGYASWHFEQMLEAYKDVIVQLPRIIERIYQLALTCHPSWRLGFLITIGRTGLLPPTAELKGEIKTIIERDALAETQYALVEELERIFDIKGDFSDEERNRMFDRTVSATDTKGNPMGISCFWSDRFQAYTIGYHVRLPSDRRIAEKVMDKIAEAVENGDIDETNRDLIIEQEILPSVLSADELIVSRILSARNMRELAALEKNATTSIDLTQSGAMADRLRALYNFRLRMKEIDDNEQSALRSIRDDFQNGRCTAEDKKGSEQYFINFAAAGRDRLQAEYDSQMADTFSEREENIRSLLREGLLVVAPRSEAETGYAFKPKEGQEGALKDRVSVMAIEKQNAKLFAQQEGESVDDARARVIAEIKKRINDTLANIVTMSQTGRRLQNREGCFTGLFEGMFEGQNDLTSTGEKQGNNEFLRELFADQDFFRGLIFETVEDIDPDTHERTEVLLDTEDRSWASRAVVKELIDLLKSHFHKEADELAANLLNRLYLEKLAVDDRRERRRKIRSSREIRGYTNFGDVHEHNLATTHFTQYLMLQERYGLATGYDQLESFDPDELKEVNVGHLVGLSFGEDRDSYFTRYLDLYKSHFGDAGVREIIREALLPHAIADEKRREFIQAGAEFTSGLDHPAIIMRIIKQRGLMTMQEVRAMLKKSAEDSGDNDSYGLREDIRQAKRAWHEAYSEEIEAILDQAA